MAFVDATRQFIQRVGSVDYVNAGISTLRLPNVNLLSRLYLTFSGTYTVTHGTGTLALSSKGPWNLIRAIRLQANLNTEVKRLNGFAAHVDEVISNGSLWEPDDGQRSASFATDLYNAPVVAGANTWNFCITINVTPNERDPTGLVLLQTNETAVDLVIEWAAPYGATIDYPGVVTGNDTAALTGTLTVHAETFTLPADPADQPDLTTIFQQLETYVPINAVGDQTVDLLKANVYARIMHTIETNGALDSTNPSRFTIRYNNAIAPYDIYRMAQLFLQRRRYRRDLPAGVFVHDFYYQGFPGYGGGRDLIAGATVAMLQSVVNIPSGTTLGTGTNFLRTTTSQFVNLGMPQR